VRLIGSNEPPGSPGTGGKTRHRQA